MKHIKNCHLGDNWKQCPPCVKGWNETCEPKEIMTIPGTKNPEDHDIIAVGDKLVIIPKTENR